MVVINSSSMILGFVSITKAVTVAPKPLRVGSTVVALCSIERHDTARNVFSPNHKPQIRRECLQPPNFAIVRIVRLNPQQYHLLARTALWLLAVIVVSGASVRLTGSGLGCSDWPNCEPGHLIPEADFHAWVEFGNRIVTGLVSIAVVLAVLGSTLRRPLVTKLTKWSWGLVAGVAIQIALGAITVITHLSPPIVMGHFLLSMVLIWNATVLEHMARPNNTCGTSVVKSLRLHICLVAVMTAIVVVTGTMVTGSGPHGGDENVERLALPFSEIARLHGGIVVVLLLATVILRLRVQNLRTGSVKHRVNVVLFVMILQAAIGYTQYFTELPVLLVGFHVAGATVLWISAVRLVLATVTSPLEVA
jgi:cytochrome c oxidase assembly protein subunit 15|tara:strand:- start:6 stop:1094 length:1089 start_codon:yes stop_codon:yes gene_type:complete